MSDKLVMIDVASDTLLFMLLLTHHWWWLCVAPGILPFMFRGKTNTTFSNQDPNSSNIELAKPSNLSAEALREKIEAENEEQVRHGNSL